MTYDVTLRAIPISRRLFLTALPPTLALLFAVMVAVSDRNQQVSAASEELAVIRQMEILAGVQALNPFPEMADAQRSLALRGDDAWEALPMLISVWDLAMVRYSSAEQNRLATGEPDPLFDRQRESVMAVTQKLQSGLLPTEADLAEMEAARAAADLALFDLAATSTSGTWPVYEFTISATRSSWVEFVHVGPALLGVPVSEPWTVAELSGRRAQATERVDAILAEELRAEARLVLESDGHLRWREAASSAAAVAAGFEPAWDMIEIMPLVGDAVELAIDLDQVTAQAVGVARAEVQAEADRAGTERARLLAFAGSLLILTGVLTWAVIGSILGPLQALTRRASSVARGDLDSSPLPRVGGDELARLGGIIEDVVDGLSHLDRQVQAITAGVLDHPSLDIAAPGPVGATVQKRLVELREASGALLADADTDSLTGLLNRRGLVKRLLRGSNSTDAGSDGRTSGTGRWAVVYIDLDKFKAVNDLHGHKHGDAVLVAVAERLRGFVRPDDLVCRLGGDEFVLVTRGLEVEAVDGLTDRVENRLRQPVAVEGTRHQVGASVGVSWIDDLPVDLTDDDVAHQALDRALEEADHNMLEVKARRRRPGDRDHLTR